MSRKQERAIGALLASPTTAEAAQNSGVSEVTLWRWMKNANFKSAYRDMRNRTLESTMSQLSELCNDALKTLKDVINDEEAPAPARVAAAKTVIELTLKTRKDLEIEDRLRAIEEEIQKQ